MAFKFDIQETLFKGIPRVAKERIDRVIESLSEKPQPGSESIHEARKNLKSLRALLRMARGSIDEEIRVRENLFFRDAGRSLSTIRDPQALLEALDYFSKPSRGNSGPSTPKQTSILAFTEKARKEIERDLIEGLPRGTVRNLLTGLREARRRTGHWFAGDRLGLGNEWDIFVGNGVRRTYRKAKNLVWQFEVIGHERADDKDWHELRKCCKALGYQLRLLKPIWPGMLDALGEQIDQLTDRLGDANDLSILRGKILSQPYDPSETYQFAETRRFFLQSLDRRKTRLHSEAFQLARLIYAEKAGQFERRLGGYWQIWRSQKEVEAPRNYDQLDSQPSRQGHTAGKAKPEVLASSLP
jgi:CHAD domain-containing protein